MSDDTSTELDSLNELLDREEARRAREAQRAPSGFDPAALFLLGQGFLNLFDPTESQLWFRCKGCTGRVRMGEREKHHAAHRRALAKAGERPYPATRKQGRGETPPSSEKEDGMSATATRTRSSARSATPKNETGKAAAKTTTATGKAATAKKQPAAKKEGARAEAGRIVALAAEYMKGKKGMTATELAKAVVAKHKLTGKDPVFNVAFAVRAAERRGETFKKNNDRPALYSLKG